MNKDLIRKRGRGLHFALFLRKHKRQAAKDIEPRKSSPEGHNMSATEETSKNLDFYLDFYLDGLTNLVVCIMGLAINAAAIGILCRQKTSSIFVKLMLSLVTYDLLYVFLFATCYSMNRLSDYYRSKSLQVLAQSVEKREIYSHLKNIS